MVGSAGCVVVDEVDAVLRLPVDRLVQGEGVRLVLSSATANKELRRFLRRWTRHIELVDLQKGMHVPDTLSHHCLVIEDRQTIRNIREKEAEPKETPEQEHYHHNGQLVEQQQQEYLEAADVLAEVAANVIEQMRARRTIMFIRSDAPTRQFLAHLADHGVHALELAKRYSAKREEGSAVYLATEEAARGIDISDVDLVLILDVPRGPASYAHLAGRTGRFGRSGAVVSVVPVGAWGFYESKMRGMYKALGLTPTKLDFVD
ncbi:hypothetical protein GGI15_002192 [Coemansia interrupta]|uniref:ATP-dependent RNA helicase n=1 Tax=Coemansia interrupta TaxID=1126814 RepID=A0A9W8HGS5_9FUNG|nr:hypothetical protein GGI15_002192 [Coemansia interrupta]